MSGTNQSGAPSQVPEPGANNAADAGASSPQLLEPAGGEGLAGTTASTTGPAMGPQDAPPQPTDGDAAAAIWRNNVTIQAMWSVDETRNAFASVSGAGWRKIYNATDGAFQALVTLASQARQTGRTVNLREESDGMIREIYLW